MKIEWEVTVRREAELSADQVREMFGLGGTEDEDLAVRVACLWSSMPYHCNTGVHVSTHSSRLLRIDGMEACDY